MSLSNEIILAQLKFVSDFLTLKYILIPSVIIPVVFLYVRKHRADALTLLATTLAYPYVLILKAFFMLPRPGTADLHQFFGPDVFGFPSGHVVFYTAYWGFLIYLSIKLKHFDRLLRKTVQWVGVYYLMLIGASRIGLGFHYLRDVVGGYLFGGLFLIILIYVDKILSKKRNYPMTEDKNKNS